MWKGSRQHYVRPARLICWRHCINSWPVCNSTPTRLSRPSCAICAVSLRRDSEWSRDRRRAVIQRHFGKLFSEGRKAGIIRKDIPTDSIMEILLSAVQAIMNPPKIWSWASLRRAGYSAIVTVIWKACRPSA